MIISPLTSSSTKKKLSAISITKQQSVNRSNISIVLLMLSSFVKASLIGSTMAVDTAKIRISRFQSSLQPEFGEIICFGILFSWSMSSISKWNFSAVVCISFFYFVVSCFLNDISDLWEADFFVITESSESFCSFAQYPDSWDSFPSSLFYLAD